ncbi:MAG: polyprenyl synthetase family protein [Candidatus Dojkabacteria bacterium]
MEAKKALNEIAQIVDVEVEKILKEESRISNDISPIIKELLTTFPVVSFGGKRLRAAFVYYSYIMHGGKNKGEINKVGGAIELLHSYLLAHDDVMDRSDMRHSKPTINRYYEVYSKMQGFRRPEAVHFGDSMAVNAGDILCHIGLDVITNSKFESHKKLKALSKINCEFKDTGYGQVIDVYGSVLKTVREDYVMQVHYFKTGKYTYETPLHVGAILAGANDKQLAALTRYSIPGGIAFQIQDDILGMFGNEKKIGKRADSDLREGKKTLLIVKALEKATPAQKKRIEECLGNQEINYDDLEDIRKIMIDTGSLEYSKDVARKLVLKAKRALKDTEDLNWNKKGLDFLEAIADYMITREY